MADRSDTTLPSATTTTPLGDTWTTTTAYCECGGALAYTGSDDGGGTGYRAFHTCRACKREYALARGYPFEATRVA